MGPTSKNNREKIFQNLQKNLAQNRLKLDQQDIRKLMTEARLKDLLKKVNEAIKQGKFVEAELYLNIHRDQTQGIYSEYIREPENGEAMDAYVSDARAQDIDEDSDKNTFQDAAARGLSYFQIAERMLDIEQNANSNFLKSSIESVKEELRKRAQAFLQRVQAQSKLTHDHKVAAEMAETYTSDVIMSVLAPFLANYLGIKPEEAAEQMLRYKDFGWMDEKPFALVTLTRHEGKVEGSTTDVARIDVPICGLIEDQRKEYEAIRDKDVDDASLPLWYKQQSAGDRWVIKYYAQYLASTNPEDARVIPTQMIKHLSGLRNARETRGYRTTDSTQPGTNTTLNLFYVDTSAGNFGHHIGNVNEKELERITAMAMGQAMEQTEASTLLLNSLISTHFLRAMIHDPEERQLDAQVSRVAQQKQTGTQKNNAVYGKIALNRTRTWMGEGSNNMAAAEAIYEIACNVGNACQSTATAENPLSEKVINLLKKINDVLDELYAIRNGSTYLGDNNNQNMQLVAKMKQTVSLLVLLRREMPDNEQTQSMTDIALFTFCKSNKDRGGEQNEATFAEALERDITGESPHISLAANKSGYCLKVAEEAFDATKTSNLKGYVLTQDDKLYYCTPGKKPTELSVTEIYKLMAVLFPRGKEVVSLENISMRQLRAIKKYANHCPDDVELKKQMRSARIIRTGIRSHHMQRSAGFWNSAGVNSIKDSEKITAAFMKGDDKEDKEEIKQLAAKLNTKIGKGEVKIPNWVTYIPFIGPWIYKRVSSYETKRAEHAVRIREGFLAVFSRIGEALASVRDSFRGDSVSGRKTTSYHSIVTTHDTEIEITPQNIPKMLVQGEELARHLEAREQLLARVAATQSKREALKLVKQIKAKDEQLIESQKDDLKEYLDEHTKKHIDLKIISDKPHLSDCHQGLFHHASSSLGVESKTLEERESFRVSA